MELKGEFMHIIATGNTADIIKYDNNTVCKLFKPDYPLTFIEHEFINAQLISGLGIETPTPYKVINLDGRNGIVYERVCGETLYAKLENIREDEQEAWIDIFANLHRKVLNHHVNNVIDYKDFLKIFAADSSNIVSRIDALKNGDSLLHGDYHPGNVIVDTFNRLILIDMMNICKGPVEYDVARTYFLLEGNKEFQNKYLKYMGYKVKELVPYLEVIMLIREKELK